MENKQNTRTSPVTVNFTAAELNEVKAYGDKAGEKLASLARRLVLKGVRGNE